jgi:hypothetical protein
MLGLPNLRQGSGVTPDSGKAVLRSRLRPKLPATAGQPAVARDAAGCRNHLLTGYSARKLDLAAETHFLSRRLSFRRLLWCTETQRRERNLLAMAAAKTLLFRTQTCASSRASRAFTGILAGECSTKYFQVIIVLSERFEIRLRRGLNI